MKASAWHRMALYLKALFGTTTQAERKPPTIPPGLVIEELTDISPDYNVIKSVDHDMARVGKVWQEDDKWSASYLFYNGSAINFQTDIGCNYETRDDAIQAFLDWYAKNGNKPAGDWRPPHK